MPQFDLSLLVSSFQRPWHLRRVLESIARQRSVPCSFEVVITDDGSRDDTQPMVSEFARGASFPIRMTSHPHGGFQLARCRNEGVAASSGEYLLFLDGDCLIPPNHLAVHWRSRQPGTVWGGHTVLLEEHASEGISLDCIRTGRFMRLAPPSQRRKLLWMGLKGQYYNWTRHPGRPKLYGGNIGIWRSDYQRVNGYDEKFRGWGCEDDDLAIRLRMSGLRIRSINLRTCTYHLWHPPASTKPRVYNQGSNYRYLNRNDREARCDVGLEPARVGERAYELLVDTREVYLARRAA